MPTVPDPDVYAWFEADGRRPHYYTLLFTHRLAPAEVLRRLAAPKPVTGPGPGALPPDEADPVDVHDLGEWTLAVEGHGFEAYVATAVKRLSVGTEVVMLTYNVMAHCRFRHVVDGEVWTDFDAVDPSDRCGLHPDRLVDDMRRVGLDPDHDFDDMDDDEALLWCSQTMALAESITGIRVAPEIFDAVPALSATMRFAVGE
ncbi:DUF6461 domain-containing protein [Yinghuangia seranimata]|uniref:DUF6461 domain-containing protein n=1 Tax=Yinghuangia seranimata TaxID=408067 RepID=UPI00248CB264|nr:DUF6461 domain-containing protein [Yinghuangia seranimata]MDI2127717.1 DUF6461 domain-containing protein [Yinghuangia seranimata]